MVLSWGSKLQGYCLWQNVSPGSFAWHFAPPLAGINISHICISREAIEWCIRTTKLSNNVITCDRKNIGVNVDDRQRKNSIAGETVCSLVVHRLFVRACTICTCVHAFFIVAFNTQHTGVFMCIDALFTVWYNFAFHAAHKPFRARSSSYYFLDAFAVPVQLTIGSRCDNVIHCIYDSASTLIVFQLTTVRNKSKFQTW